MLSGGITWNGYEDFIWPSDPNNKGELLRAENPEHADRNECKDAQMRYHNQLILKLVAKVDWLANTMEIRR